MFMWWILNGLHENDFFMCTIPSPVKHAKINPPRLSFLQLKAMFSFINVKFSLSNILVLGLNVTHLSSIFIFSNAFLQYFLFAKRIIVFFLINFIRLSNSMAIFNIWRFNFNIYIPKYWYKCAFQFIICNGIWNTTQN